MTMSSTGNRISYAGNGSTTPFSFPYYFLADDDLKVILVDDSTNVETLQTITTHYTVSGAGVGSGGTVTMVTAPATGETLVLIREEQFTQGLDLEENDPFPSDLVEQQFDSLTMQTQQLNDQVSRSVKLSDGDTSGFNPALPLTHTALSNLSVNAAGTGYTYSSLSVVGTITTPGSVSDSSVMRYDGTTGTTFGSTGVTIDDNDNVIVPGALSAAGYVGAKGADVASATPTILADGNYFDVTGTTTIAAFTVTAGTTFTTQFDGILQLTHHATNLDLPGEANITTAAGDVATFFATGTDTVQCLSYTRADGTAVDYATGTFTPTLYGSTTPGTPVLTSAGGGYVRIGSLVQVQLRLAWSSLGSAAGDIRVGALPFTVAGQSAQNSGRAGLIASRCTGLNLGAGYVLGAFVEANTTYISLVISHNTASNIEVTEAELASSGEIYLTGTYQI